MQRSEYAANESLAESVQAKRYGRVNYLPCHRPGPVEITVKLLAFVSVLCAVVYLLAQSV